MVLFKSPIIIKGVLTEINIFQDNFDSKIPNDHAERLIHGIIDFYGCFNNLPTVGIAFTTNTSRSYTIDNILFHPVNVKNKRTITFYFK